MKPLCTRYAFASFRTLGLPVRDGDSVKRAGWHWALGLLQLEMHEVLGASPARAPPGQAAQNLRGRGASCATNLAKTLAKVRRCIRFQPSFQLVDEVRKRKTERAHPTTQLKNVQATNASLDTTDVRLLPSQPVGQLNLRQLELAAQFDEQLSK